MTGDKKAYVVSVEMGYGHLRAARPLAFLADESRIVTADSYDGIPKGDRLIWENSTKFYNAISRMKERGLFGTLIFKGFDYFQRVGGTLPGKSKPTFQLKQGHKLIKRGWGRDLIEKLNKNPLPLLATFFTIGHMAEQWNYGGPIYVLVTDADISRAWAPLNPESSRITYFAPTEAAEERLISYGVNPEKVFLTGFPLPAELVKNAEGNLRRRLGTLRGKGGRPTTVTFAIGGAGAQGKIALKIIQGLAPAIKKGDLTLNLIAGLHKNLGLKFRKQAQKSGLENFLDKGISVIQNETKEEYFQKFDKTVAETDVLWTKPSELSFYAGLGLPILIAPPLGAHEVKNKEWLVKLGAGVPQEKPGEAGRWLMKMIRNGRLAEAAEAGFQKVKRDGADKIAEIL